MTRRFLLGALLLASSGGAVAQSCTFGNVCGPIPAWSGSARDGAVQQGVANTFCANLIRRNVSCTSPAATSALNAIYGKATALAAQGSAAPYGSTVAPASRTWQQVLRSSLAGLLPWPYVLGADRPDGKGFDGKSGGWGGGGATGGWTNPTCDDLKLEFDAAGNLIIPSYNLDVGAPIFFGDIFYNIPYGGPGALESRTLASSQSARVRRILHLANMTRMEADWLGVIGPMGDGFIHMASVAYRNPSTGAIMPRGTDAASITGGAQGPHGVAVVDQTHTIEHKPCPPAESGGTFHYYGSSDWAGNHFHNCIMYVPNESVGWSGYAINKRTTLPWPVSGWPNNMPPHLKECPLSPKFLAALTNALHKDASDDPGYSGVPHSPVAEEDGRPGDARVGDLGDNPETGTTTATPNEGSTTPPTTPTSPTAPTSTTLDLGPNPNVGAPTLEEPPTGIMDPIFDWLPDLPSITLNTNGTQCPTWVFNLTEFAPDWLFMMDSHCDVVEQNREAIGALMIVLFGLGAGMIILRA